MLQAGDGQRRIRDSARVSRLARIPVMHCVFKASRHAPRAARLRGGVLRACLFGCLLFVGACSVVGALYERLDLLLGLEADSWLDLDAGQKSRFRLAARGRIEQNRREELPRYIGLLELAAMRVEESPDAGTLLADAESLRLALRDTIRRSLPMVADALARLRPEQIEYFAEQLEKSNAEYAEDYLEAPPDRFRSARLKRSREAVERWTGRLDTAQRERLAALVDAIPDGSAAWSRYSLAWQQALLAELRAGTDSQRLLRLMEHWWTTDASMDPGYVAQLETNRRLIASALAELLPTLSQRQRARATREFRDLAGDLRELQRPKAGVVAP